MKKVHKIFKVRVTETFVHEVEIDTDDYEDIKDEWDAQRYVENNIDDFTDDFDYDCYERESHEAYCDSCDTVEDEEDC